MKAITLHDSSQDGLLSFDLADILREAGLRAVNSTWQCRAVECVGVLADILHTASERGTAISGGELVSIAGGVTQVIEGDFIATRRGETVPWLVVRAIDASFYVVLTEDHGFIDELRARFRDVRESPDDLDSALLCPEER